MKPWIVGRVVDAKGFPVEGAEVSLDRHYIPESRENGPLLRATTDGSGAYAFAGPQVEVLHGDLLRPALRARAPGLASRRVSPAWTDRPLRVPDLVLVDAITGRVDVTWEDGAPGEGVDVDVSLAEGDGEDEDSLSMFAGFADESGTFAFGPIPDRSYYVFIRLKHPTGAPANDARENFRLAEPIRITLRRGLVAHGRLVTRAGEPLARYRVGAMNPAAGDPEIADLVATGDDGRFRLEGVSPQEGSIGVYAPVPPRLADTTDPIEYMRHIARYEIGGAGQPVLVVPIRREAGDLGDVVVPDLTTLRVRLRDTEGNPAREGHVFWSLQDAVAGRMACYIGGDGVATIEGVPVGVPLLFDVSIHDPKLGAIQDRFTVSEVVDGELEHRVRGAGVVVVRFLCDGVPVHVPEVLAGWLGSFGWSSHLGERSEIRGYVEPGVHPELRIRVPGFRPHVIPSVTVASDGPTCLTAHLERE